MVGAAEHGDIAQLWRTVATIPAKPPPDAGMTCCFREHMHEIVEARSHANKARHRTAASSGKTSSTFDKISVSHGMQVWIGPAYAFRLAGGAASCRTAMQIHPPPRRHRRFQHFTSASKPGPLHVMKEQGGRQSGRQFIGAETNTSGCPNPSRYRPPSRGCSLALSEHAARRTDAIQQFGDRPGLFFMRSLHGHGITDAAFATKRQYVRRGREIRRRSRPDFLALNTMRRK